MIANEIGSMPAGGLRLHFMGSTLRPPATSATRRASSAATARGPSSNSACQAHLQGGANRSPDAANHSPDSSGKLDWLHQAVRLQAPAVAAPELLISPATSPMRMVPW